ncbi:MAG TPA: D-2-hydroxyacid dehydrogenase [Caulobacteraceae bacterium]|jgi:phosphoglycerate dehydrogenase-like enzyme|nr:D-2-hydroxyacid dehydrogenase [Caulobacteraceae bacterium]
MPRLLIYEPSYRRLSGEIASRAPGIEILLIDDAGKITLDGVEIPAEEARPDAAWANYEVFMGPASRPFSVAMLKSPSLKWVQSAAAGFDHAIFGQIVEKGAALSTSHGQAVGMADYVVAGVLDHFQGGPARRKAQAEKVWWRQPFREVTGTQWLIIGYGAIGQGVARRAKAFGATVVGVRRDPTAHPDADRIVPLDALPKELPAADVVVLSIPLGASTHHLANESFFQSMKARSVLVNVGRGGLVDEVALLAALDRGVPEHAVLDVFETEPLPPESPFWSHPRVSLTGHASGITGGQHHRNQTLFLDNLARFASGEALLNRARPEDVLAG